MSQMHPQQILVVDNNVDFLTKIATMLRDHGHTVSCVDDIIQCLDYLTDNSPDIIFIDYLMPLMDGDDICRAIRNYNHLQNTWLVIFSPIAVEKPMDYSQVGVNSCIAKGPLEQMWPHIEAVILEAQEQTREKHHVQVRGDEKLYHREVTDELLEQNSHFKLLLQNMSQGILEIISGRVVNINRSGAKMLNVHPSEIIGASVQESLPRALLQNLERDPAQQQESGINESGVPVHFNDRQLMMEIFPMRNERGGNLVFLTDVTERKRMESMIEAANLTENLGYVFSGIRHEIGNPVNSIKMALSVLQRNIQEYDQATITEFLDRSLQEIARIEYLLKALKNYSLFESPVVQDLQIIDFLHDFTSLIRNDFEQLGITIRILFPEGPFTVKADSRALHHVLLNLVTNAADALEDIEGAQITISSHRLGDMVVIKVDDNGKGISEADQQHLFKPFFTSKATGTGLGLAIVRKMLGSMGGAVKMESYQGIGTTVTILLPKGEI